MTTPVLTPWSAGTIADRTRQLGRLVTTPLLPADYLDLFSPLRTGADLRGRERELADPGTAHGPA